MQILCTVPYDTQPSESDCIKYCAMFRPLQNHPNKLVYDVTIALSFFAVCRWLPANKSGSLRPWWLTILVAKVCAQLHDIQFLHRTEWLSFSCGLSVVKYRLSAMKNKNTGIGPK